MPYKNTTHKNYQNNIYTRNAKYKNIQYNNSSLARNYLPDYEYQVNKIKKPIRKIKKDKYIKAEQGLNFLSLKFVVTVAILATFVASIIFIEALIIQKKFEIDTLNENLKEITENNKNLETDLAKNLDLDYVEYIATSELGMQAPASHQIVHINVPKESYSQKNNNIEKQSFLSKISNLLK